MKKNKSAKDSNTLVWVLLGVLIIGVFSMPYISKLIDKITESKPVHNKEEIIVEEKVVDEETLNDIHFPIMRTSKYSSNTYYNKDVFKISDMSNDDILYTAFTGIENVNINNNTLESKYIDLRIKNMLGKNVKYELTRFYVPQDAKSNYKGFWNYDANRKLFVYQGGNANENKSIEYYDLTSLKSAEYDNRDIIVYYYVLFAKVENNKYTLYSDPSMTNIISEGNMDVPLDVIFENIDNSKKRVYQFRFKDTLCSYSEYCLYEGAWVDE